MSKSIRILPCAICGHSVSILSWTTGDPGAPEMVKPTRDHLWMGFVKGDHAPEMIVCCSEACMVELMGMGVRA